MSDRGIDTPSGIIQHVRIATWNVNSLKARLERVDRLARARRSPTSC